MYEYLKLLQTVSRLFLSCKPPKDGALRWTNFVFETSFKTLILSSLKLRAYLTSFFFFLDFIKSKQSLTLTTYSHYLCIKKALGSERNKLMAKLYQINFQLFFFILVKMTLKVVFFKLENCIAPSKSINCKNVSGKFNFVYFQLRRWLSLPLIASNHISEDERFQFKWCDKHSKFSDGIF